MSKKTSRSEEAARDREADVRVRAENETMGQWLRRLRESLFPGYTVEGFAKRKLEISGPYLSMIERGRAIPSIDVLLRIASIFHIDKEGLLKLAGYDKPDMLRKAMEKSPPESGTYIEAMKKIARAYGYGYTFTVRDFVSVILGRYLLDSMKTTKTDLLPFIESISEVVSKPRRFFSKETLACAKVGGGAIKLLAEVFSIESILEDPGAFMKTEQETKPSIGTDTDGQEEGR